MSRWAPFLFSFLGRGLCTCGVALQQRDRILTGHSVYIFVGSIMLHKPVLGIVAGTIVAVIGLGYAVLEYIPSIEPPQNMRDAGGEWGAEQI